MDRYRRKSQYLAILGAIVETLTDESKRQYGGHPIRQGEKPDSGAHAGAFHQFDAALAFDVDTAQ